MCRLILARSFAKFLGSAGGVEQIIGGLKETTDGEGIPAEADDPGTAARSGAEAAPIASGRGVVAVDRTP